MQIVGGRHRSSDTGPMSTPPSPARTGLSQAQAQALLLQHGPNALDTEPRRRLANEQRRAAQRLQLDWLHTRAGIELDAHRLWDLDD